MSQSTHTTTQTIPEKYLEEILVVPRKELFANETIVWHGVNTSEEITTHTLETINKHQAYIPRYQAEDNQNYKQIIPYMLFEHNGSYFVMQRKKDASETRLANKYSLGIGGHMRKEDITDGATIFEWAKREFEEEVSFTGNIHIKPLGILNDDTNDVGKVHLGLVLILHADNGNISIKDEHKSGQMFTLEECIALLPSMESWSQLVLKKLAE